MPTSIADVNRFLAFVAHAAFAALMLQRGDESRRTERGIMTVLIVIRNTLDHDMDDATGMTIETDGKDRWLRIQFRDGEQRQVEIRNDQEFAWARNMQKSILSRPKNRD